MAVATATCVTAAANIAIPRTSTSSDAPINEPMSATPLVAAPAGVRILIVDDDARLRRTTAMTLSRIGFHVITAEDAGPAIALAEATPPDLALVDFNMPTSGLDVVRRLKALYGAAVWVAVFSGDDGEEVRSACFDAGADDVLAKPAMVAELRRRMIAAARTQQAYVESRLARERADRLLAYGAEASAMLAHDLNNGLAVALSNVTYLRGVLRLEDDDDRALSSTINALRRMSGLVANFVDIQRFEDAACKPRSTLVNVRHLLLDVIDVHASAIGRTIKYSVVCDPTLTGRFDEALIERVLHNLIGNAVRYCTTIGHIRVSATACDPNDPSAIEIEVFNSGPPVATELRPQLCAKYARGAGGKRGFGLYFCRLACEAHGGSIEYRSQDDGPTFYVRLPGRA
jgi:two-component system, sensor histidine kinase and response regulator